MSKYPNPVRGYVPCPVCQSEATVHQVGEGRLIAEGEPTKNARNLGLKYYRCPSCGNSSMSKSVDSYIESNMSLEPLATKSESALDSDDPTVETTVELVTQNDELTEVIESAQASDCKVGSVDSTVEIKRSSWVKRGVVALGVLLFLVWMVRTMMKKRHTKREEVNDVVTA